MSNLVTFKRKTSPAPIFVDEEAKAVEFTGFSHPDHYLHGEEYALGVEMTKAFDFRNSFRDYPEVGIPDVYTKQEILKMVVRLGEIANAAVFARDMKEDVEAANELADMYRKWLDKGIVSVTMKCIPEHLIGYLIFLGEDKRTRSGGQHPLSKVFNVYEFYSICFKINLP